MNLSRVALFKTRAYESYREDAGTFQDCKYADAVKTSPENHKSESSREIKLTIENLTVNALIHSTDEAKKFLALGISKTLHGVRNKSTIHLQRNFNNKHSAMSNPFLYPKRRADIPVSRTGLPSQETLLANRRNGDQAEAERMAERDGRSNHAEGRVVGARFAWYENNDSNRAISQGVKQRSVRSLPVQNHTSILAVHPNKLLAHQENNVHGENAKFQERALTGSAQAFDPSHGNQSTPYEVRIQKLVSNIMDLEKQYPSAARKVLSFFRETLFRENQELKSAGCEQELDHSYENQSAQLELLALRRENEELKKEKSQLEATLREYQKLKSEVKDLKSEVKEFAKNQSAQSMDIFRMIILEELMLMTGDNETAKQEKVVGNMAAKEASSSRKRAISDRILSDTEAEEPVSKKRRDTHSSPPCHSIEGFYGS